MTVERKLARRLAAVLLTAASSGCRSVPEAPEPAPVFSAAQLLAPVPTLAPSNNRDWSPDLAVMPYAEVEGDKITMRNIRYCTYRSDDEYVVKHYDRAFDAQQVRSVDFIVVPFKQAEGLAHTMLSFGFENQAYLSVSVEARLEKGESYAPLLGSLRQFELMYVVADERDVILRRTKHRDVDVYVYRTTATPEQAKELFLDVVRRINKLYREPEFYDTLTNNCTTNIVAHVNRLAPHALPMWDPRIMLPGYTDRLAYELGWLDSNRPFDELRKEARVNERANRFADRSDFSQRIRR
ncbi:MAG: DUF4105 domain-containing protein [Pirellulaceae bacterium]